MQTRLAAGGLGSVVLVVGLALLPACGDGAEQERAAAKAASWGDSAQVAAVPAAARAEPEPRARPLPAFDGWTLEGERFEAASLVGRRSLLFFFNPTVPEAAHTAEAVASVAELRGEHNFQVVGVALAAKPETVKAFAQEHGLDFPIIDDAAGRIASRLALRAPTALVGTDAKGNVIFAFAGLRAEGPDPTGVIEANLREALRLPPKEARAEPVLGERPQAPNFTAERLRGSEPLELADFEGRGVVLIFFLHTCPHCHKALEVLTAELEEMPEAKRPALVGVSVSNRTYAARAALDEQGLDSFPVVIDPDHSIRGAYGVVAGVPDIVLIDAERRVAARIQGWREERDPALIRMRLAKLAGLPVPMLLHATGYSGNDTCGVCHELEHETWLLTSHATAFDTLVRHGADTNRECIGCHVVGYGESGGYSLAEPSPHLEGVGCETCHARGGPHLTPAAKNASYEQACVTCHDQKHSLGFEYATFLPKISHQANAELAQLPLEEKRKLLAERGRPRAALLPETAEYVGSEACRSCHAAEYETWSKSGHAQALASLKEKGEAGNAECLACHTTAFGRPGGFPRDARPAAHADLARVGCESCHGPGGHHVPAEGEEKPAPGSIVSLGDKCDSCVILQICGSCHDEANDPGFEFEVLEKIEAQRHGTIEPSGAPAKPAKPERSAGLELPGSTVVGALEHAFAVGGREVR